MQAVDRVSGEKLDECTIFVYVKIENVAGVVYEASDVWLEGEKTEGEPGKNISLIAPTCK